jgi:hypothetical protein
MMQQPVYLTSFKYVLQVIKNNILKLFDISVALVAMEVNKESEIDNNQ